MIASSELTFELSNESIYLCSFPVSPLDCNASLIICRKTGEAAVVDPGGDIPDFLEIINHYNAKLTWILLTHAHFDHCMSIDIIHRERKNTIQKIALHPGDFNWYENIPLMAQNFGIRLDEKKEFPEINLELSDQDLLEVGRIKIKVIHTPGHSKGSVCFYLEDFNVLIAGDTLFQGSIGRTDLPGGSFQELESSIKNKLYVLPDETTVITGHGFVTTTGMEKKTNAFVRLS